VALFLRTNGMLRKTIGVNIGKSLFREVHARFGPRFRLAASGGARLEPDVYTDMTNLGFTVIEGYGLTETSPVSTFNPIDRQKAGSIGIPVPRVEVRIVNPDENGQGEISISGPNVMQGYYKKPDRTAEVLRDGWFYSGDLGYRDRDGYFFITGRSKEMIVLSTGKKIFPEELEKYYKKIPSIKEICLIQGERGIEAAVVPDFDYLRKMNLANSRETIAFAIEDLAKDLPPYKRITGLKIFKDPLPVTRLGKLRRTKVRELYERSGGRAEEAAPEADAGLLEDPVMKKLLACIEPFSPKKNIAPDDNLELDLGLDSLARVELVVSIEKTFGISLPDSFGSEVFTVKDAVVKIKEQLASGTVAAGKGVKMTWADILSREPSEELKSQIELDSGVFCSKGRHLLTLMLRCFLSIYGRLSIRGTDNLPSAGPFIIAPNHLSLADAPAVMCTLPWVVTAQTFFLGTTDFKKGVGIIAKELNIPIVPAAIRGTYDMLPAGVKVPKPAKVDVTFGKPIYPDGMDYDEIVKKLYEEVVKLLEEEK
jgi:long-chain acyl-CoA synthetase